MPEVDPAERTGCAVIAAAFSCLTVALTVIYYFIEVDQVRHIPSSGEPGLITHNYALIMVWTACIGVFVAWFFALLASLLHRRLVLLLILETPLFVLALLQCVTLLKQ